MCALKCYIHITRNELTYLITRKDVVSLRNLNNILAGSFCFSHAKIPGIAFRNHYTRAS